MIIPPTWEAEDWLKDGQGTPKDLLGTTPDLAARLVWFGNMRVQGSSPQCIEEQV